MTSRSLSIEVMALAHARSTGLFRATMPPKAASGSPAKAFLNAVAASAPVPKPQGVACLTMQAAGELGGVGQVGGERAVVLGSVGEGAGGLLQAVLAATAALVLAEVAEHLLVAVGGGDDQDEAVVLGGGADHAGAADVDVLDRL